MSSEVYMAPLEENIVPNIFDLCDLVTIALDIEELGIKVKLSYISFGNSFFADL